MTDEPNQESVSGEAPKKRLSNAELQKNLAGLEVHVDKIADTMQQVVDAQEAQSEQTVSMMKQLEDISKVFSQAINNNASPSKAFEPMEQDLGTEREAATILEDNRGDAVMLDKGLHDVDSPEFKDKMKMLAFMEEPVRVFIHQTNEAQADQVFDVGVSGKSMVFVRGREYVVPRKFVEGLARAKPVHYDNEQYTAADGTRAVRYPSRRGLRYPFSVLEDKNPMGDKWLAGVLAEP